MIDVVLAQQLAGKRLAVLQAGGCLSGPKYGQAPLSKYIGNARNQRGFRADDG